MVAVGAFLGTLWLKPTPIDQEKAKINPFYWNNNIAVTMQVFAGITSIIAGFAIAVIILMVSRTPLKEELSAQADNKDNLLGLTTSSFVAAFLTSLLAALLFASGSGQFPQNSTRAYAVVVSPVFVLTLTWSFLSLGLIMLVTYYKLEEVLNTVRKIYYVALPGVVLWFSITAYEACFRLIAGGLFLFVVMAFSTGGACFLILRAYYKRKRKIFHERKFSRYVIACVVSCFASYVMMTLYFEEQLEDSWLMPPLISESFLIVFSLLMGWSLIYVPTRKESSKYWKR